MRKSLCAVAVATACLAGLVMTLGPAGAAITVPTGNPFVVPGVAGVPQAFTVTATGFTANSPVFVEQCDGVSPSAPGWTPTEHCDLGSSPSPAISNGSGVATFPANDLNLAFTPFKGASPQGLFNCLSPNQAALSNGLPNDRNCKLRVSSNNTVTTGDQAFLNLQLPDGARRGGRVLDVGNPDVQPPAPRTRTR